MRGALSPTLLTVLLATASSGLAQDACPEGRIEHIFIDNHSIFDVTLPEMDRRVARVYRVVNALHMETREDVIRRILLFREGDCLDPELLSESERLLRGYDFLARVDVFPIRQADGTYHVVVYTRDEWSTAVDLRVRYSDDRFELRGAQLIQSNLFGTGRTAGVFFRENRIGQDWGFVYGNPQFVGPRWMLETRVGRSRVGTVAHQALTRPFLGERGRWAVRQAYWREERDFEYLVPPAFGATHLLLPVREAGADLTFVRRFGRTGRRTTLGAGLIYRSTRYPWVDPDILVVRENDFDAAAPADSGWASLVLDRVDELRNVGAILIVGQRHINWVTRRHLDNLYGEQDVPLGLDIELAVAPPLPGAGREDDTFANVSFFTAANPGRTLTTARFRAEGRRIPDAGGGAADWVDLLAEGELLLYRHLRRWTDHTLVIRATGAGGWQTRVPYQLTLGGTHAVRGYAAHHYPGGRRVVLSIEDRFALGKPFSEALGFGGAAFVDVGRTWAGDALFGVDSGWRVAAGVGLRAAFPAESRNVYRVDFAMPIESGAGLNSLRILVSVGEPRGLRGRLADGRLGRSLRSPETGAVLHFPSSARRNILRP